MEVSNAIQIVQALADGVDPHTGEAFPDNSPYQHPQTVRALFTAVKALEFYRDAQVRRRRSGPPEPSGAVEEGDLELTPQQETLYEKLKHWRNGKALKMGFPPFTIVNNAQLKRMVTMPVTCTADLLTIKGFGEKRTQTYGEEILALCAGSSDEEAT